VQYGQIACMEEKNPSKVDPLTWSRDILGDEKFPETDRRNIITIMWAIWSLFKNGQ
jgi:hypothetical protein